MLIIHAFIKQGDTQEQVPLAFILMASRQKVDYINILPSVKTIRSTIVCIFPEVNVKGCTFP